jgi:6-phosphogluconolactonase
LGPATAVDQHAGSGPDPERQDNPYAHCIRPDPTNRFAIATDLGADKLYIYEMDLENGKLNQHAEVAVQPGAGPRHLLFHPNGKYMYLLNELGSSVIVYHYSEAGRLEELQTISTLPEGFQGENLCADLRIQGRYLYVSNRKHDSIAWFLIDENTGRLTYQDEIPSGGREPRGLTIDPSGSFVLAAHERSDNVVVFQIDPATGRLLKTGHEVKVSKPVYAKFAVDLTSD